MNRSMQHTHPELYNLINGLVGVSASFLGVISTYQEQLEYYVRVTGGILGIMVAIITLWNMLKAKKKR